jgi:hypothetical protein
VVGAICVFARSAYADKITEAEELFRRGKAFTAQGRHAEACPMFEESQRLDPQMGTLLNVALCHESVGRTASAWGEFRAVEQQARAANPPREDRVKLAREHADKLEPRLSRIKIVVAGGAHPTGLVVKVDGEAKAEPLWPGIPVDPGARSIEASAPGKKPATLKVKIDAEGAVVPITIPKLEDAPVAATPPPKSQGADLERVEEYAANRARRTTGFVVGGIGIATALAGGAFGVAAIISDSNAKDSCPAPCLERSTAADEADRSTDRAFVFANIANVTIPLGIIGAAVGAYLVLTSGPTEKTARSPRVSPSARGLAMSASW